MLTQIGIGQQCLFFWLWCSSRSCGIWTSRSATGPGCRLCGSVAIGWPCATRVSTRSSIGGWTRAFGRAFKWFFVSRGGAPPGRPTPASRAPPWSPPGRSATAWPRPLGRSRWRWPQRMSCSKHPPGGGTRYRPHPPPTVCPCMPFAYLWLRLVPVLVSDFQIV